MIVFLIGLSILVIALNETIQESLGNISENNASILNEPVLVDSSILDNSLASTNVSATDILNMLDPNLATVINGKSIFDDPYIGTYMQKFNNLMNVEFKTLQERDSNKINFTSGNFVEHKVEGFRLENKDYGIHMMSCFKDSNECVFRVNGLYTRLSTGINPYNLNDNYMIRINAIHYDHCDRYPCDYFFDAYDLVEAEVIER